MLAVRAGTLAPAAPPSRAADAGVKLPTSGVVVLDLPFTKPTGYGLGKAGWVSARLAPGDPPPPLGLVREWVEESYRAVAPKTLVKQLDAR